MNSLTDSISTLRDGRAPVWRPTGRGIVQVTHSEKNAEHGNRIIQMMDGWIDKYE